jgi:hypothetical protein
MDKYNTTSKMEEDTDEPLSVVTVSNQTKIIIFKNYHNISRFSFIQHKKKTANTSNPLNAHDFKINHENV